MTMTNEEKYEKNYQGFMKELTKISKKYGIGINACGCFDYYDLNGFKDIEYYNYSSSGDIRIAGIIYSDGTEAELYGMKNDRRFKIKKVFSCTLWWNKRYYIGS